MGYVLQKGTEREAGSLSTPFWNMETLIGSRPPPFLDIEKVILFLPSKTAFPRPCWYRNLITVAYCAGGSGNPPLLRWKAEGGGVRGTGLLPSPCKGLPPQLEGLRKGGPWRPSVWGGCLGVSQERLSGPEGWRLPNQSENRRSLELWPSN